MKKLLYLLLPLMIVCINGCKDDDKKPGTVLVTPVADTSKIIDTTIEEPGIAPLADTDAGAGMRKLDKAEKEEKQKKIKISCNFGQTKFNKNKRPENEAPGGKKGKPIKPGTEPPPPPPPPGESNNIIYLNPYGRTVSNTMWNTNGPIDAEHSGLADVEINAIATQVRSHFTAYNVTVTLDKAVFDAAPLGHKIEVIITESWQWYGQAGGVAYINSFFWNDGSPAWVFSTLLNYNLHYIAEATAHEAMHTLGLRHQSDCSNGVVVNQYANGFVMGNSYYVPKGLLRVGTSSLQCQIQDDNAKLLSSLGSKQFAYNFK